MNEIREIRESELDALLTLYKQLHERDSPPPNRETVEAVWSQISNNPAIKYFGVFLESQLVSSATITLIPNLTRSCKSYGVIENVVTHSAHRRKGYGTKTLQTSLQYAWDADCYKVMLMTGRLNSATFEFYESVGFKRNEKRAFVAKPSHT